MFLAHKIKISPTVKQLKQLYNTAGACRFAYNWAIDEHRRQYTLYKEGNLPHKPTAFSLTREWTKQKPGWAKETSIHAQQRAIANAEEASMRYAKGLSEKPAYKKRSSKISFYIGSTDIRWFGNRVSVPLIGRVKLTEPFRFKEKPLYGIVEKDNDSWYIVFVVDAKKETMFKDVPDSTIGIDVGLKHIATCSDGTYLDSPDRVARLVKKARRAQKRYDKAKEKRKKSGKDSESKNDKKRLHRIRVIQEKINNIRKDLTHKFTTSVCKSHATIVVESLDIDDMIKDAKKGLRQLLTNSLMRQVIKQLEYKANTLIKAPKFYPSSKICSNCGSKKDDLKLSDRVYKCPKCGNLMDRDLNAAINLMKYPESQGN